ncbi:MAG: chemotaxis-specific protein-glutamate methyltransferase CheB, partial [Synergistaceae bacterium]|nr:chemotaxis-specific protein-glutamate methyltransferase CheB [Synergistaceae bacterium]
VTHEGAEITMKALSAGAVDFVTKPSGTISLDMEKVGDELRQKVLMASRISNRTVADMVRKPPRKNDSPSPQPVESRQAVPSSVPKRVLLKKIDMVVIASSTGGPRALQEIIPAIKKKFPVPILVVQHMPVGFTAPFAQRLNEMSQLEVVEGAEGLKIQRGVAVIAPGGYHMTVERKMGELYCHLLDTPPVRSVKPAADVLFTSVAEVVGGSVLAVVLTGMGRDGTDGARVLKEKGAYVLAEAKETCVVYGMPQSVVEAGLVDEVLPLGSISTGLERLVSVNAVSAAGLP